MFLVKNFPVGQRVLVDSSSGQSATQGDGKKEEVTRQGEIPLVKEVSLVSLGYNRSRPYLLVRSSTDTAMKCKGFCYHNQLDSASLKPKTRLDSK